MLPIEPNNAAGGIQTKQRIAQKSLDDAKAETTSESQKKTMLSNLSFKKNVPKPPKVGLSRGSESLSEAEPRSAKTPSFPIAGGLRDSPFSYQTSHDDLPQFTESRRASREEPRYDT